MRIVTCAVSLIALSFACGCASGPALVDLSSRPSLGSDTKPSAEPSGSSRTPAQQSDVGSETAVTNTPVSPSWKPDDDPNGVPSDFAQTSADKPMSTANATEADALTSTPPAPEPNAAVLRRDQRTEAEEVREEELLELRGRAERDAVFLQAGRNGVFRRRENALARAAAQHDLELQQITQANRETAEQEKVASRARYQAAVETAEREYAAMCQVCDQEQEELEEQRKREEERIEIEYENTLAQLEEDGTPTFPVARIEIDPNSPIAGEELLRALPNTYNDPAQQTKGSAPQYEFRVLRRIVATPDTIHIRRQVSTRTMEGLTKYLVNCYQRKGYAGVYVYVPAGSFESQTALKEDTLRIRVIVAKVGQVHVNYLDYAGAPREEGKTHYLKESFVKNHSPVQRDDGVRPRELEKFVNLLNQNPDRHVRAVVTGSDEPNRVDVTYDVQEADPWHFYTQIDNAGTEGRQWNPRLGLVNTNLTGNDDSLSLMAQVDIGEPTENHALFGRYEFPLLTPRLRMGFQGGYGHFDISPETTIGPLNFLGYGSFAGSSLRYNLFQVGDWLFDLTGSLSWERSRLTRELGPDADIQLGLYDMGFQFHRSDFSSGSSILVNRQANFSGSDPQEFEKARTDASPDFVRYLLGADHFQYFGDKREHAFKAEFLYVVPANRLVPAKMTTFGGLYTVRGYGEDELVADGGILATLEYRYRILGSDRSKSADKGGRRGTTMLDWLSVWLVGFIDYGKAQIKDPVPGEVGGGQDMLGVGPGLIFDIGKNLRAEVYNGWALLDTERGSDRSTITDVGDNNWYLNFIYRW